MKKERFTTVKGNVSCTYIKLFTDYLDAVEPLGDAERGRLFSALLLYARTGECAELPGDERFLFPIMRAQVDRDLAAYAELAEKRSAAGRAGARGRAKSSVGRDGRKVEESGENETQSSEKVEESSKREIQISEKVEGSGEGGGGEGGQAIARFAYVCSEDKDNDNDNDKDEDEEKDKDKDKDEMCTTTTTSRACVHSAHTCAGVGAGTVRSGEAGAPSFLRVAEYFRCECCVDDAGREAEKFIAYNAHRRWDCLPDWRLAADLWAARIEREDDPLIAGVELWRQR